MARIKCWKITNTLSLIVTSSFLLTAGATLTVQAQRPLGERVIKPTSETKQSPLSKEKVAKTESPFAAEAARVKGGLVKAMLYVDKDRNIVRCFNSRLAENAESSKPCGFQIEIGSDQQVIINFGFQINDRFILTTPVTSGNGWYSERQNSQTAPVEFHPSADDKVLVTTSGWRQPFMIFVF
jgi:hypothetical protein